MYKRVENTFYASWTKGLALIATLALALAAVLALSGCGAAAMVRDSSDAYSWAELSAIATEIHDADTDEEGLQIATSYNLLNSSGKLDGKSKSITLSDGTTAHAVLVGIRADDLADGGKAGLTFAFTDAPYAHAMNEEATNEGGWEKSQMRSWLNGEFADKLPSDLKGALKAANKKTNSSAYTSPGSVSTTSDKLWLLSYVEVAGSPSPNALIGGSGIPAETYAAEGKQYQLFKEKGITAGEGNDALVRAFTGADGNGLVMAGEACPWWLRSLSMTWTSGFAAVNDEGDPFNAWVTDHEIGVSPGFCL